MIEKIRSFWIRVKRDKDRYMDKDRYLKEVLFYRETKLATCARLDPLKDSSLPPKASAYCLGVYLKLAH